MLNSEMETTALGLLPRHSAPYWLRVPVGTFSAKAVSNLDYVQHVFHSVTALGNPCHPQLKAMAVPSPASFPGQKNDRPVASLMEYMQTPKAPARGRGCSWPTWCWELHLLEFRKFRLWASRLVLDAHQRRKKCATGQSWGICPYKQGLSQFFHSCTSRSRPGLRKQRFYSDGN